MTRAFVRSLYVQSWGDLPFLVLNYKKYKGVKILVSLENLKVPFLDRDKLTWNHSQKPYRVTKWIKFSLFSTFDTNIHLLMTFQLRTIT